MLAYECIMIEQPPCRTAPDWDKISGKEISDSSRPSHKPKAKSETTDNPFCVWPSHKKKKKKGLKLLAGVKQNN